MTDESTKRSMIIVWSWNEGGQVSGGDRWTVSGHRKGLDELICLDLRHSPAGLNHLLQLAEAELAEGRIVFLFLHRRHGYTPAAIESLQQQLTAEERPACRCFLFGEGGDPLYLFRDERGLLGATGTFSARIMDGQGRERRLSAVADAGQHLLKAGHFQHTWQQYEHAFRERILELREDLFDSLGILLEKKEAPPGAVYRHLSEPGRRIMLLRLLSFTGRLRKGARLERELRACEEEQERTFSFDDLQAQLSAAYPPEVVMRPTVSLFPGARNP